MPTLTALVPDAVLYFGKALKSSLSDTHAGFRRIWQNGPAGGGKAGGWLFLGLFLGFLAQGAQAQIAINAGGPATGSFAADSGFSGGTVAANTTTAIDTSAIANPAPAAAYLDERYGNFTYSVANLTPGGTYRVRLHFVETYWSAPGQRVFNVSINGTSALANFDIYAAAGARNKAVLREFDVTTGSAGSIAIQFSTSVNNAKVDAIEILPASSSTSSTAAAGTGALLAINTGGPASGSFVADTGFSGGSTATNTTATIDTSAVANPAPQAAYRDERYGTFTYTLTRLTPATPYRLRLHFAETYWTAAGQRVFNVLINGATALANFDILAAAGARNKAIVREFDVPASATGAIAVQFTRVTDNAKIDAIEVLPMAPAGTALLAINVGGPASGNFVADGNFSGGTTATNTSATVDTSAVTGPAPQAVYQTERYGNFTYTLRNLTPSAPYRLRLHFVESYWTAARQRVFNVAINGATALSNFDIFATAGARNKAVVRDFDIPASATGSITLQFSSVVNNAKLDAIEIFPGATASATAPKAPTSLTPVAGNGTVTLNWTAAAGASSYNVKRAATSGGPYTTIASNVATTSYTNTGLTNGTAYYYAVSAVNSLGESANSTTVTATPAAATATLPGTPVNLAGTPGNATATLTWSQVSGATGYNVKRATASGGPFSVIAGNLTNTGYTNSGLTNGTTYYYVVSAMNAAGEGPNSAAFSVTPVAPPVVSATTNQLGFNFGSPLDWVPDRVHADVVMMSRDFVTAGSGGGGGKVGVDSNGWPTSDFSFLLWDGINQMNGTYALSFKGQATVSGSGIGNVGLSYDAASNTSSGTFQYTNSGTSNFSLNFTGTRRTASSGSGTGVTQIKLMRPLTPGSSQPHPTSEIFNRATKTALSKVRVLRFMDYLGTNSSGLANWSDRPLPTWASFHRRIGGSYGWQGSGGPLEYVARLSNELGTDAWINIPALATDDYVRKTAQLFAFGSDGVNPYTSPQANPVYPPLNANLNLYVEYSNELWNTAGPFRQSSDNCQAASNELSTGTSPLNFDKTWNNVKWASGSSNSGFDRNMCWRRVAKRGVEISNIFRSVFGDSAMITRVRPLLMTQIGYADGPLFSALQMMLGYYNNFAGNFVSPPRPPGYYFYGAGGSAYYNPSSNVSSLNAFFSDPGITASGFAPELREDMALVSALGLKRIAYEGGPSLDRLGGARDAISPQAVNDPRMTTAIVDIHNNAWSATGGELLVYYQLAGDYQWGFTSNIYNLATPKMAAIDQLRSANKAPLTYGTAIPGSVSGTAPAACSRNWGCTPLQPASFSSSGGTTWAAYPFRATSTGARSVTLSFSSAGAAQVAVYVDGAMVGTQSTSGGSLIFNAGTLASGLHSVIVRAVTGSFTLNSVAVQ